MTCLVGNNLYFDSQLPEAQFWFVELDMHGVAIFAVVKSTERMVMLRTMATLGMVTQQCSGSWQEQCCSGAARQGVPSRQPEIGSNS